MFAAGSSSIHQGKRLLALIVLGSLALFAPDSALAKDKKKAVAAPVPEQAIDYSYIVWPNPPAIARIVYETFYTAQKESQLRLVGTAKTKAKWMDRLAGTQPENEKTTGIRFHLGEPYGLAVDSKGIVYVADQKVGAIFMFNPETHEAELLKNGVHAHFVRIIGLAMDDNDRLFVSDPGLRHVLVFNAEHKMEDVITNDLVSPSGLVIDRDNRLLYISDNELDQVLVFDADTLKLKRKIGTTGHNHELTAPGDFSKPTGLAVDKEGNVYVADTMNDRIEIFDADGNLIRTFGKNGDGPGYFARPKGVAIDGDGHVWVADGVQDRVQVFTSEGQLLISIGGHGLLPGQFQGLVGIASDVKRNRIVTSEIFPGRVQQFRYVTDAEYATEKKLREEKVAVKASATNSPPAPPVTQTPAQGVPASSSAAK
jgi:DNA-binding beta-propeller fold protein YncE